MSVRFLSVLAVLVCCSISNGEEIPLDQIWALDMPGTKDIHKLEPDNEKFQKMTATERIQNSLVSNTRWLLNANNRPPYGSQGERAFVLAATGLEALELANEILSKKKSRKEHFLTGEELTLVFFSYSCGRKIRLDSVSKSDEKITVKYHFFSHPFSQSTTHIALIPIGKLPPGRVNIAVEKLDDESLTTQNSPMDKGRIRQIVSESFSFGVEER